MAGHKQPPKWYGQGYGKYSGWEKAVQQARELLEGRARQGDTATYTEVSRAADAIPWPEGPHTHEGRQMGYLLGEISVVEWLHDRPLLSAIVVYKDSPLPGPGFHGIAEELGYLPRKGEEAALIFWAKERERAFDHWRKA